MNRKTLCVTGGVVLAVAIIIAVEEFRIADLRDRLATVESTEPGAPEGRRGGSMASGGSPESVVATKSRGRERSAHAPGPEVTEERDFGSTVRKMWDNPAGKSMMNQGVKMAIVMLYGDFIETLNLTKEEADYFRQLLGSEVAAQQELGMKMMGASEGERKELGAEMERRTKENEEAIKSFLNNAEDFERYDAYQSRLPDRQQLDGLRTAMADKNIALDEGTESQLVEVMHGVRTQAAANDVSDPGGEESRGEGTMAREFEESWATQQAALREGVAGILSEEQQEAFFEYQTQLKELQLMGIRMADQLRDRGETAE